MVARPYLYWSLSLIYVPQVNVLALARHDQLLGVLPLYFLAHERGLELTVVESDYDLASLWVPNCYDGRHSSTCNLVSIVLVELRHHQHCLKVFEPVDALAVLFLRLLLIHFPDTGIAVRRAGHEFVSAGIPVHTAYIRDYLVRVVLGLPLHVREDAQLLEIGRVLASQIPEARFVEVSSHKEESLSGAELSPVDVAIATSLLVSWSD